jgi:GDP-mannose transporter
LLDGSHLFLVGILQLTSRSDLTSATPKKGIENVSPFVSYSWMISNCLSTAFYALIMKARMKSVNFKDFDVVFYSNLLSTPVLLLMSWMYESQELSSLHERYFGDEGELYESEFKHLMLSIILSGFSGFAISFGSSWCVRTTSSTTYSMVGALNKLPISILGMILFDVPVTVGGVLSILIAFLSGIVYTRAKSEQAQQQKLSLPISQVEERKFEERGMLEDDKVKQDG